MLAAQGEAAGLQQANQVPSGAAKNLMVGPGMRIPAPLALASDATLSFARSAPAPEPELLFLEIPGLPCQYEVCIETSKPSRSLRNHGIFLVCFFLRFSRDGRAKPSPLRAKPSRSTRIGGICLVCFFSPFPPRWKG